MKKIIYIIVLLLLLVACSIQEERVGSAAMEHLASTYHLDDVEVISVEQENPRYALIVYVMDRLSNGKNYEVIVQSNEAIPIEVEGTVNVRKLEYKNSNYVASKHQTYQEEHKEYQKLLRQLEDLGVEEIFLSNRYFDETTRTIHFQIKLEHADISSDQLVDHLDKIADIMLENIDTNMSMKLAIQVKNLFADELRYELIEIELPPHDENDYEKLIQLLDEQLSSVQSANKIDEAFIGMLEQFNLTVIRSRLNDLEKKADNELIRHELKMGVLADYEWEDLLAGIQQLQENGFNNTFVQLTFQQGSTDFCQVKRIQTTEDIEHCFTDIVYENIQ